jgi:hypothetical protein
MRRPRIHLATCDHCARRIAWSRKRRQWLALNPHPLTGTQLRRRMHCPGCGNLHDPSGNLAQRADAALRSLFSRSAVAS